MFSLSIWKILRIKSKTYKSYKMNFELSEEQQLIRETVRDFAEREIKPVAMELDEKAEFSHDLTKKIGEL